MSVKEFSDAKLYMVQYRLELDDVVAVKLYNRVRSVYDVCRLIYIPYIFCSALHFVCVHPTPSEIKPYVAST